GNFNLDMDRSPGFGSTPTDFSRSSHLVSLRLPSSLEVNLASRRNSPDRSTKSTRLCSCTSTACKHRVSGSLSLPSRGPFHLSFTVLCAIGHYVVFSLRGWSPFLPTRFLVSRGTLDSARCVLCFVYGAFTLSGWLSQNHSTTFPSHFLRSEPQNARTLVWALSLSLAATQEIDLSFSSSGYLDVSVPQVPFHTLWIGVWILKVSSSRFPHSDISGSRDICSSPKLFAA